jgi:ABC-type antimicrobial peptide transport system permease subunit
VNNALPAALVGLTALVTSALVHAGYAVWWLAHMLIGGHAAFNWTGALTVSGTASAIVLIAGLIVRRMVSSDAPVEATARVAASVRVPSEAVR